jgi:hypothetical protein
MYRGIPPFSFSGKLVENIVLDLVAAAERSDGVLTLYVSN